MSGIHAFVIHLARATERAPQVERLKAKLPVPAETFPAVDARAGHPETSRYVADLRLRPAYPFPLTDTEVAVFLSHRTAWRAILERDLEAGLIVEDDVDVDEGAFAAAVSIATPAARDGAFVRLPDKDRETRGEVLDLGPPRLVRPAVIGLGMQAQLVGRDAARKLLDASDRFDRPVDVLIQMRWLHQAEVLTVWPTTVRDISGTLGGSTLKKRKGFAARIHAEVARARFRTAIARLSRSR